MTLRRRLVLLHSAFAIFTVLAAVASIYGVQVYVERAANRLEELISEAQLVENLRVDLKTLDVHLHELITGRRRADAVFDAERDAVLSRLDEVARYTGRDRSELKATTANVAALRGELALSVDSCVELMRAGNPENAARLFKERIENQVAALDVHLGILRSALDARRQESGGLLFTRNARLLTLSLLVAAGGVGLVVAGAMIVRRRLVAPIAGLVDATKAYAAGDLAYRAPVESVDELGTLATSLNTMAASLRASQLKFKSLFENLRDAVVVCDANGVVIECHDNDSALLGRPAGTAPGKPAADIWPNWGGATGRWESLIKRVLATQEIVRVSEVPAPGPETNSRVVDAVAYPVDYAERPYVAIVLRDVTERQRLSQMARQTETMEASVNVARGIAHDFKNLLHSAVNSLSSLVAHATGDDSRPQAQRALSACEQAASLARRLSRFAGSDRGSPERLPLAETVQLIVDAMDEGFRKSIELVVEAQTDAHVEIDRDHLTQIVLNLLINAREAMPDGGTIRITTSATQATDSKSQGPPRDYVLLSVADTGCGISESDHDRVFQPFFTSKPRGDQGPHGLGLAAVYAAVKQAGGFIQLESKPDQGATFRLYIPIAS
jgi:PAS domain S-box-containing protein